MAFDLAALETRIRAILQAPGIDLATISAKRVRKRLMEDDPDLTTDVVREHKDEIDRLIGSVYEEVSADSQEGQDAGDEEGEDEEEREDGSENGVPAKPAKKAPKRRTKTDAELTDAELARQLSSELNGRPRTAKRASSTPKRGKKRKSAEVVDSDGEGGEDVERPRKRGGGFSKEYSLRSVVSCASVKCIHLKKCFQRTARSPSLCTKDVSPASC